MNAPDYLSRLRQESDNKTRKEGTAQTAKRVANDFTQFTQLAPSANISDFSEPLRISEAEASELRGWLERMAEDVPEIVAEMWRRCQYEHGALAEYLNLARGLV